MWASKLWVNKNIWAKGYQHVYVFNLNMSPSKSQVSTWHVFQTCRVISFFDCYCAQVLCATRWSICARGSTLRSYLNALGNENLQSVRDANTMVGCCSLLMGLICARGGSWLLEQPEHSLMARHPRFRQLCRRQTVSRWLNICFFDMTSRSKRWFHQDQNDMCQS